MNRYMEHQKKFLQHKECVKKLEKTRKVKKMGFTEAFLKLLEN